MSQQILSQDEVDALLQGIATDAPLPEADADGDNDVRAYDLSSQERIVRGRMPAVEIVCERFARDLRLGLFNLLRRNTEVQIGGTKVQKYSAFLRDLTVPSNFNIVAVKPLRGSGLVVCEPSLVFGAIDALFGGGGKFHTRIEGRDFSPTEMRVIMRILEIVTTEYRKAWAGIYPIELEYQRSETQPQFASIATPSEMVLTSSFNLELGEAAGAIHVCIPYATFEPIRDVLYSTLPGEAETDKRWLNLLKTQIKDAEVEMVAELGTAPATVEQLLALKPGDFIELDIEPLIEAKVNGVPVFECHYGTNNGHYAIKIDKPLTGPESGWLGDAKHGR
jgi:flagellar motor switch protein FliM